MSKKKVRCQRTVVAFGTFDILHPGHLSYLKQARAYGDRLVVVVARDTNAKATKKHAPHLNERERLAMVGALKIVDRAILGDLLLGIEPLKKLRPAAICLGYDHGISIRALKAILKKSKLSTHAVYRMRPYCAYRYKSSRVCHL